MLICLLKTFIMFLYLFSSLLTNYVSISLCSSKIFFKVLFYHLLNLFFPSNHLSSLWKNRDTFMAWCRVIQTHLSRLWSGQPVSGCSSMHYHTWFSLLATPQRTVSIAALLVVPKPWWFMLVQTLLHLAALAHTEHPCLKRSAQGSPVYFLETINPPNWLRHGKSCKSVMQVEAQVTGSKQKYTALLPSRTFSLHHQHRTIQYW